MYNLTAGIDSVPRVDNTLTSEDQTSTRWHSFGNRLISVRNACLAPLKKAAIEICQLGNKHPKFVLMSTAIISATFAANQLIAGHRSLYALTIIAGPSTIGAGIVGIGHLIS